MEEWIILAACVTVVSFLLTSVCFRESKSRKASGKDMRNDGPEIHIPEIKGRCVRVTMMGDVEKPKMMFICGWPDSPYVWGKQIDHFSDDYCLLFVYNPYCTSDSQDCNYDMPFLGFSFVEIALDCIDILKKILKKNEKIHLIGHDYGSYFSNEMVNQDPSLFKTLTLIDIPPQGNVPRWKRLLFSVIFGVIYRYIFSLSYVLARYVSWDLGYWVTYIYKHYFPLAIIMRKKCFVTFPENPKLNPMLNWLHIQFNYVLLRRFLNLEYIGFKDSIIPVVPMLFIYGSPYENAGFEEEMRKHKYGYEKIGNNHWMFFTHPKEFNAKFKAFILEYET